MTRDPETAMMQHLLHNSAVQAEVSDRVYPGGIFPKQCVYPAVAMILISGTQQGCHDESAYAKTSRIQVISKASTLLRAKQIAALIESILDGFRGELGDGDTKIKASVRAQHPNDDSDVESGLFWINQDFMVYAVLDGGEDDGDWSI
jgi:hypothetical protein